MTDATSKQEGGDHYRSMKIQPVEFIHANNIPFIEGAVIKYVVRHRSKNKAQDIRKAIHFLELLLQLEYPEKQEAAAAPTGGVGIHPAWVPWTKVPPGGQFP